MDAPLTNCQVTYDGLLTLAAGNLAPNPTFLDFSPTRNPKRHKHKHPPHHHGHHVHAKKKSEPRHTKQTGKHKKAHHTHIQNGPLAVGSAAPDVTEYAPLPAPDPPTVDVLPLSSVGYRAATYGVAPFYVVADPASGGGDEAGNSPLRTQAGPRTTVTLTQGQYLSVTPYSTFPKNVAGLGIAVTAPGDQNGQLYAQEVEMLKAGLQDNLVYAGPLKFDDPIDTALNSTQIAQANSLAVPEYFFGPAECNLQPMTIRLSYSILTSVGWTASQAVTDWITITQATPGCGLWWRPTVLPPGTIEWRGEYQLNTESDVWYSVEPRRYSVITPDEQLDKSDLDTQLALEDFYALVYQPDLETYPTLENQPELADRIVLDTSGVPAPDTALPAVSGITPTPMDADDYEFRSTHMHEGAQGPPSTPTAATVPSNSTVRVIAQTNQLFPNGDLMEQDPTDGLEMDSEKPVVSGVSAVHTAGVVTLTDTSLSTSNAEVRRTRKSKIDPTKRHSFRTRIELQNYVSGAVEAILRQLDASGNILADYSMGTVSSSTPTDLEVRAGPAGTNSHVILNPATAQVQIAKKHKGNTSAGARNFKHKHSHTGGVKGHAHPKKRKLPRPVEHHHPPGHHAPGPVPGPEDPTDPVPPGSYAVIVQNPPNPATRNADVVYAYDGFENGKFTFSSATITESPNDSTTTSEFTSAAAIDGSYGWHIAATSTTATNSIYATKPLAQGNRNQAGIRVLMQINQLPSSGFVYLAGLLDSNGILRASVTLSSTGTLTLVSTDKNNVSLTPTITGVTVTAGSILDLKIMASQAQTTNGTVTATASLNAAAPVSQTSTAIDWSTITFGSIQLGAFTPSSAGISFDFDIDSVCELAPGEALSTAIPGNAVEYYGAQGIPPSQEYGVSGTIISAIEGATYCASIFMQTTGIEQAASPLVSVYCNEIGQILQSNGPVVTQISGTNEWRRYFTTSTAPAGTAYMKFIGGTMADGLMLFMGLQVELGSVPTPFTTSYNTPGTCVPTFDLSLPLTGSVDPIAGTAAVKEITAAGAIALTPPGTTVTSRFRSSHDQTNWSAWYTDVTQMPGDTFVQVEVTLTTTNGAVTPVVYAIYLDYIRARPILTRSDGSEFDGGAIVVDMAPVQAKFATEDRTFADESVGFRTFGTRPGVRIARFDLECFLESTAAEITALQGQGLGEFWIEDPTLMIRYIVRFFDCDFGKEKIDRQVYSPITGLETNGAWLHKATVTKAQVVAWSSLAPGAPVVTV
jgi:hypothetical protein